MTGTSRTTGPLERVGIHLGGLYATSGRAELEAVVDECVALCLHDPVGRVGGMCHVLDAHGVLSTDDPARFAEHAVPLLLEAMLEVGALRERLVARVFGASDRDTDEASRGAISLRVVESLLEAASVPIIEREVRGPGALEVCFNARSGLARVRGLSGAQLERDAANEAPTRATRDALGLVAIGASTGGVEAVARIFGTLSPDIPPVVIALHMPATFTGRFAERLDALSSLRVEEGHDGQLLLPGHGYVIPGGRHGRVVRDGWGYRLVLGDEPLEVHYRPSVDVLFHSVARACGRHAVGVVLTGMGSDGAEGSRELAAVGAITLAQDRESCVVFGMPGEAIARGGAAHVVALDAIASAIESFVHRSAA